MKKKFEQLTEHQNVSMRDPLEVISSSFSGAGITSDTIKYSVTDGFIQLLKDEKITLLVTREYENLIVALREENGKLIQSLLPLAHPSGLVTDKKNNSVFVAATRSPNQLMELKVTKKKILMPARIKFYPGNFYFHDLALINSELFSNSVGMNGIVKINFNSPSPDPLVWFPKCVEDKNGKPNSKKNFLQLNSIAAGKNLYESFFTASGDKMLRSKPGHLNYPVDKRGVIFSARTREVIARGLTRPHSARLVNKKIWVSNSGYGEVGFIENEKFVPVKKFQSWTRGLCIKNKIAFVGLSRVIPRFSHYAPGIKGTKQICGIVALSLSTGEEIGKIIFPFGNQIFAIDYLNRESCLGFPFSKAQPLSEKEKQIFFQYEFF